VPVAILVPDATVWTMNDEFGLLVACNLACGVERLLLGIMHGGRALVAFALDGPSVVVGNNVLILAGHENTPFVNKSSANSRLDCRVAIGLTMWQSTLLVQTTT